MFGAALVVASASGVVEGAVMEGVVSLGMGEGSVMVDEGVVAVCSGVQGMVISCGEVLSVGSLGSMQELVVSCG